MKILMVISEAPPVRSGVARVAEQLSGGFRKRGFEIDILSLQDVPRLEFGELRLSSMPLKLGELRKRLPDYDLVHLHGPAPTFSDTFLLGGIARMNGSRPPVVYTHHSQIDLNSLPLRPLAWAYNQSQKILARIADHVVVTTPAYKQSLARFVPGHKLSVIPWGVDYARFAASPRKDGPFTVVYLGQIRPYKGLPVLLKAAHELQGVRVWVIGNGHTMHTYRNLAARLDIPNIHFWGRLPDEQVIPLLQQAHAIVLPSVTRSEAFGIVLLEGMAAGMVPVASHLPGVYDVVGNEGFTFPPGDSQALRNVLERLRDDPALRVHLAQLAQAKARLYPWERSVFGYERIFNQLVAPPITTPAYTILARKPGLTLRIDKPEA